MQNKEQDMSNDIKAAMPCQQTLDYLLKRRSVPIKQLSSPGPDQSDIDKMIKASSRVPDHGKLFPWYYLTFQGDARYQVGQIIKNAYLKTDEKAHKAKLELEENRFLRAPVIIGVISRIRRGKHPIWEQVLSAGAACQNLCLAANALGYGSNWLTEWYSYNESFKSELGLDKSDHIAGFIFIGTPNEMPLERDRPDTKQLTTKWSKGISINKGDQYERAEFDFPEERFDFNNLANNN